jgi:N4-(beta-N-acetylglucosaminyl)-L-asparaginase
MGNFKLNKKTKMIERRRFLKTTLLAAGGLTLASACTEEKQESKKAIVKEKPLMIGTWDFAMQANKAGWQKLDAGLTALDAVEAAAQEAENDPTSLTVGLSALPDREGRVTLDSCVMRGDGGCGAVMCLEHIKNPVSVARAVMEKTPHIFLTGDGALQFALSQGFKKESVYNPEAEKAYKKWLIKSEYKPIINIENHDTIGLLCLDSKGTMAGACTTSGMAFKMRGRVGDSPIIGAGLFVDEEVGGATATGHGEEVIRVAGSHLVVELMRQGRTPEEACKEAVERIYKKQKHRASEIQIGFIAISKEGEYGGFAIHSGFSYAVHTSKGAFLQKSAYIIK